MYGRYAVSIERVKTNNFQISHRKIFNESTESNNDCIETKILSKQMPYSDDTDLRNIFVIIRGNITYTG